MIASTVFDCQLIDIPKIITQENHGSLSVIEKDIIPFQIKRVYYLYDVPSTATRGGHAHKKLSQLIIPLSGSFDIVLNDSIQKKTIVLNKPNIGLLICPGIWRELENFSSGVVCMVLASEAYDENDYIREYSNFTKFKHQL